MGFRYIVKGNGVTDTELSNKLEELKDGGHIVVFITDGTILRGRENGEIILLGDYEGLWNWQDIWESIMIFRELKPEEQLPDIDRPEDFFEYGVGE